VLFEHEKAEYIDVSIELWLLNIINTCIALNNLP